MDNNVLLKNLGENMRAVRKQKKLTIDQLAEKAFLSSKYIQGVEVGIRNISIKNLNKIASALDTTPEILLNVKNNLLATEDEKIFNISEKLKRFDKSKLDFIGNILDNLGTVISEANNKSRKTI